MRQVGSHSYRGYSHAQLRALLDSADPATVRDIHAAAWRAVDTALGELGVALNATVIDGRWSGPAAEEFRRRLTAVAECAGSTSNTAHQVWNGLDFLAADIEAAQRAMPAEPGRNALSADAAPAGGVVGASQGYLQGQAARRAAAERAERVMDELGRSMQGDAEYWWPRRLPPAPAGLPHTPARPEMASTTSMSGPGSVRAEAPAGSGPAGPGRSRSPDPGDPAPVRTTG
ncbi:MAG: hypothetical protein WCA46_19800, partial [Actinocatenispora sp.]